MPTLETITLHKFRGLQNLELNDLGKVNLLVGNNNSGKTSILEALSIYANPLNIGEWWSTAYKRKDTSRSSSFIEILRWIFYQDLNIDSDGEFAVGTVGGEFSISAEGENLHVSKLWAEHSVIEELHQPNRKDYHSWDENIPELESIRGIELQILLSLKGLSSTTYTRSDFNDDPSVIYRKINSETCHEQIRLRFWDTSSLRFSPIRDYKILTQLVSPISHRLERSQLQLLSEAQYKHFKSDVIQLLQQIDDNIIDLHILADPNGMTPRFNLVVEHQRLGFTPLNTFGDGLQRLFHIALKLPRAKDGFLLIDELESAIHTEALQSSYRWLVKWCAEMNTQIFATTHSLEAVDALLSVTEANDQLVLYRLEPGEEKTHVVRHGWERLKVLREELGQEVRW
ncbi:MAG: AAA family ATPase [Cyanothece sp. SIO2G6]|nr:AAA family ATPase [Cyanothece sp. SIO2G6]